MLMLFHISCCRADALAEKKLSNASFGCSGGGRLHDDSRIGEDMEVEMLMESHISRMLIGGNGKPTIEFTKAAQQTLNCGAGTQYGPCVNGKKVPQNCNTFNRNCQKK
ncbi:hypothetical protein COLO4_37973 [Corchorus olitorius]|uniref:Rapid ALkalinization Factor n=1 Tax=Corchorus olitorius TaxID=93759 RepID=A0A1R3FXR8_9ROSI|nr:hypothetical protein COLO4_37973 [Corchorus olitorius]